VYLQYSTIFILKESTCNRLQLHSSKTFDEKNDTRYVNKEHILFADGST